MKQIPLTKNSFALVDNEDYPYYSQFRYYLNSEGYAARDVYTDGKRKTLRMHREIAKTPDNMDTDHINGNRLDNRRSNLRNCTRTENLRNSRKRENNTSKYKGVSFFKPVGMWRAYINLNKRQISLGYFRNEDDAALAYNKAAVEYFGEYARLNNVNP